MCDTIVAAPACTAGHLMLFGKNSDRQRNEAQTVEYFSGADHSSDAQLTCTYVTIPQARRTYSAILCRPFWAWGAEMGANEHGVVIGNEAVHARSPACERNELPGMDLVRIGLERSATAAEALDVITTLLARHGGGGNCGHTSPAYYNNGFIVADAKDAFILETVERDWMIERADSVRSISNTYSIGRDCERVSVGLHALLREREWTSDERPYYAEVIANPNREHIGYAHARRARSTALLEVSTRPLSATDMIGILRDHGTAATPHAGWHPDRPGTLTLCMHAGAEGRIGQTTGSMVSEIHRDHAVHWVTGTAAPCTSIFKPVLLDVEMPAHGPRPTDRFDARALWWRHERLHRAAIAGDLARFLGEIHPEREAIEADFRACIAAVLYGGTPEDRARVVAQCWSEADQLEERWHARLLGASPARDRSYLATWAEANRAAGIDIPGAEPAST